MKEVDLVRFSTETILVEDCRNLIEFHRIDDKVNFVRNSDEFIPQFIDVETLSVERVVDCGVTHYMAVERKVWKYLYAMKNPVTAESQDNKISELKDKGRVLAASIERLRRDADKQEARIAKASFFERVKWVFTGVKIK